MRILFTVFLLSAAWQDLRSRKISIWLYIVFGIAGICGNLFGGVSQAAAGTTEWMEIAAAVIPGFFLLLVTHWSEGGIGSGDGWFFVVAALYLKFWITLALLFYGLMCCSACSLGMVVWGMASGINVRKKRLPFLPFLIPAWVWILLW